MNEGRTTKKDDIKAHFNNDLILLPLTFLFPTSWQETRFLLLALVVVCSVVQLVLMIFFGIFMGEDELFTLTFLLFILCIFFLFYSLVFDCQSLFCFVSHLVTPLSSLFSPSFIQRLRSFTVSRYWALFIGLRIPLPTSIHHFVPHNLHKLKRQRS